MSDTVSHEMLKNGNTFVSASQQQCKISPLRSACQWTQKNASASQLSNNIGKKTGFKQPLARKLPKFDLSNCFDVLIRINLGTNEGFTDAGIHPSGLSFEEGTPPCCSTPRANSTNQSI
jgi:hypothetical protein